MPEEDPIKFWQHLHGASAHFPIALMIVSMLFDYGGLVLRRPNWRTVGFWTLVVAAVVSVPAILSGLTGYFGWFGQAKWEAEQNTMDIHRNLALFGGGMAFVLALWRGLRKDALKGGEWIGYLVAVAAVTFALGFTGYLGAYVARGYNSPMTTPPPTPAPAETPKPEGA